MQAAFTVLSRKADVIRMDHIEACKGEEARDAIAATGAAVLMVLAGRAQVACMGGVGACSDVCLSHGVCVNRIQLPA